MTKYINNFTGSITILLSNDEKQRTGRLTKISISNNTTANRTISIYLRRNSDGEKTYFIKDLIMPGSTSLLLDDCLSFDIETYSLRMDHNATSATDFSVILK